MTDEEELAAHDSLTTLLGAPPRRPPPKTTEKRLLEAARRLLRKYGPPGLRLTDITEEAGLKHHSRFYLHFESVWDLRIALIQSQLDAITRNLAQDEPLEDRAPERLRGWLHRLVLYHARWRKKEPGTWFLYGHALTRTEGNNVVQPYHAMLRGQLMAILSYGAERGEFALIDGAGRHPAMHALAVSIWQLMLSFHDPRFGVGDQDLSKGRTHAVIDLLVRGAVGSAKVGVSAPSASPTAAVLPWEP